MPGHTKCRACHAKSSQQTWRSDAPKCNPSQEISARTSQQLWWTCLLYCACHGKCIFADPLQMSRTCHRLWKCYKALAFCSICEKKVARTCGALYILTSKCASRHNGVQFFISHLARWLRTRRFSEPTFRPSGATNHWKNTVFRDFPTFFRASASSFFWLFLFSDLLSSTLLFSLTLPISAFHLSILSEVWLLNFLRSYC